MEFFKFNTFKLNKTHERTRTERAGTGKPLTFDNLSTFQQRGDFRPAVSAQIRTHRAISQLEEILRQQRDIIASKRAVIDEAREKVATSLNKLATTQRVAEQYQDELDALQEAKREIETEFSVLASKFSSASTRRSDLVDRLAHLEHKANVALQKAVENSAEPSENRFLLNDPWSSVRSSQENKKLILQEEQNHQQVMDELAKKASELDAQDAEIDAQLNKATEQYEETVKENLELETKLEVNEDEMKQISADNDESKNLLKELHKHLMVSQRECEKELRNREAEVEEKEDQVRLLSKKDAMQSTLDTVQKDVADQRTKEEKLHALLNETRAKSQKITDELEQLQATRLSLKRHLEFSETKCKQSETELNDRMRDMKDLLADKGQLHSLPTIKDLLEQNASTLKAVKQHLQDRDATAASINHKQKAAKKELHQLNIDYEKQQVEFLHLSKTYADEESKMQAIVLEIDDLRKKSSERKTEVEKLDKCRKDIENVQHEREQLKLLIDKLLAQKTELLQDKQNDLELTERLKEQLQELCKEHPEEADANRSQGETNESYARLEGEIRELEKELNIVREEVKIAEKAAKQLKAKRLGQTEESDPELLELDQKLLELNMELERMRNQILDAEAEVASAQNGGQNSSSGKNHESIKQSGKHADEVEEIKRQDNENRRIRKEKNSDSKASSKTNPAADVTVVVDLTDDDPQPDVPRNAKASHTTVEDASRNVVDQSGTGSRPFRPEKKGAFKKPLPLAPAAGSEPSTRYRRTYTRKRRNTEILED